MKRLLLVIVLLFFYQADVTSIRPIQSIQRKVPSSSSSTYQQHQQHPLKSLITKICPAILSATTLLFNPVYAIAEPTPTPPLSSTSDKIFVEVWKLVNDNFFDNTYNNHDWKKVKEDYEQKSKIGGDDHELTVNALNLLGDKYTRILDKEKYQSLFKYDAIGVGVLFQSDPITKSMTISSTPVPDSSGALAGLQKGDIILSLNGISMADKTALQVLDMMSNDESDEVVMKYTRGTNKEGEEEKNSKTVSLKRSKEKVTNPVSYSIQSISNGKLEPTRVGYIKLSEFNAAAVAGMEAAIRDLEKESANVEDIVLDLRGNLGGGFQFALNIGGMFMNDRVMVTALGKGSETNVFRTSYPPGVLSTKPLVLLTDALSASASEVLASGLRDNCRAAVAGSTSFGKGKIQGVFGLSDGEGMTMTVAQYVSPKGKIIQNKGVEPDFPINTLNPYISMLLPIFQDQISKPDLNQIDFKKVQELMSSCKAEVEVDTTTGTPSAVTSASSSGSSISTS